MTIRRACNPEPRQGDGMGDNGPRGLCVLAEQGPKRIRKRSPTAVDSHRSQIQPDKAISQPVSHRFSLHRSKPDAVRLWTKPSKPD